MTVLSSRQTFRVGQHHRLAQSFKTIEQATERAKTAPPKKKRELLCPTIRSIIRALDQFLADLKSWPNGTLTGLGIIRNSAHIIRKAIHVHYSITVKHHRKARFTDE